MEGSRHEKAALVLASYVIGFTTAFILYAQITTNAEESYFISTPSAMPAAVVQATPADTVPAAEVSGMVSYQDGRLTVTRNDESVLLSFNPETSGLRANTTDLGQGFHYDTPVYRVSPNNDFVFFCEKQDVTKDACLGFVYSVDTQTIHPVTKNGAPVLVSRSSANSATWSNSGLTVGSAVSLDAATPWELGG